MQIIKKLKNVDFIREFIRYFFVGGSAFFIDTGVLYLTQRFIFFSMGKPGILIATALGFMAGLVYNYILSIFFVFKNAEEKIKGKQLESFIIFAIIGIIGLGLTELGMYLGITLLSSKYYLFVKVVVATVVLFWNYIARKILIFK